MKLSELIEQSMELYKKHGDMEVMYHREHLTSDGELNSLYYPTPIEGINFWEKTDSFVSWPEHFTISLKAE